MVDKKFVVQIEKHLTSQEEELSGQIDRLAKEDPFMRPDRTSERIPEFMEESREVQEKEIADEERGLLEEQRKDVRDALTRIKEGKYGICENCGEEIERARLKANPQARYCLDCKEKLSAQEGA